MVEVTTNLKIINFWTEGETTLFLDNYADYMTQVGPMKRFKTKKQMWQQLALDVGVKTPKQCEERFKTVLKRKKAAIENNTTSGAKRQCVEYEGELQHICALDDSTEPEVQLSSQNKIVKEKKGGPVQKPSRAGVKMTALAEIANKKEENKERRHKERMEAANKVYGLLEKLVNQN